MPVAFGEQLPQLVALGLPVGLVLVEHVRARPPPRPAPQDLKLLLAGRVVAALQGDQDLQCVEVRASASSLPDGGS